MVLSSSRIQRWISCVLVMNLMACQAPIAPLPVNKSLVTPVAAQASGRALPEKLKAEVLRRKGNLAQVQVMSPLEMRAYEAKRQAEQNTPLQKHFALLQVPNQVPCEGLDICDYEQVGEWQEYYDSIYGGDSAQTCAFETLTYCSEDINSPGCFTRYTEMLMYGCECNEGFSETNEGVCTREFQVQVRYLGEEQQGELPENWIITPDYDGQRDGLSFKFFADQENPWTFTVEDSQGVKVYEHFGRETESTEIIWDGFIQGQNKFLPNGIYKAVVTSEVHRFTYEIRLDRNLRLRAFTDATREIPFDPQGVLTIFPAAGNTSDKIVYAEIAGSSQWTVKISDQSGSPVWYRQGTGYDVVPWDGKNLQYEIVPEGVYTLSVTNGTESRTALVKVQVSPLDDIELYYESNVVAFLNSAESRIPHMEQRISRIMEKAQSLFPDTPSFVAQSVTDPAPFRIQQQQIEPIPSNLSAFPEPNDGEMRKVDADAQNDRIVRKVELMRQQIRWAHRIIREGISRFSIQQSEGGGDTSSLTKNLKELESIERSFYGISTTSGCFNYYAYKSRWKKKKKCPIFRTVKLFSAEFQSNGNLILIGQINPESLICREFDPNELVPEIEGLAILSTPMVQHLGDGHYKITITDYDIPALSALASESGSGFRTQALPWLPYCLLLASRVILTTGPVSNRLAVLSISRAYGRYLLRTYPFVEEFLKVFGTIEAIRDDIDAISQKLTDVYSQGERLPHTPISAEKLEKQVMTNILKLNNGSDLIEREKKGTLTDGYKGQLNGAVMEAVAQVRIEKVLESMTGAYGGEIKYMSGFKRSYTSPGQFPRGVEIDGLLYTISGDKMTIVGMVEVKTSQDSFDTKPLLEDLRTSDECDIKHIYELANREYLLRKIVNENVKGQIKNGKMPFPEKDRYYIRNIEFAPRDKFMKLLVRPVDAPMLTAPIAAELSRSGWLPLLTPEGSLQIDTIRARTIQKN